MTALPKAFLTASIVSFIIGLTDSRGDRAWGLLRPVSAVLFLQIFATNLLAKEVAKFDEECTADLLCKLTRARWSRRVVQGGAAMGFP